MIVILAAMMIPAEQEQITYLNGPNVARRRQMLVDQLLSTHYSLCHTCNRNRQLDLWCQIAFRHKAGFCSCQGLSQRGGCWHALY